VAGSHEKGEMLTGVFYVNTTTPSFVEQLNLTDQSLARMPEELTRPSRQALTRSWKAAVTRFGNE